MKRISIYKENKLTNQATFNDDTEADIWFQKEVANGSFGPEGSFSVVTDDPTPKPIVLTQEELMSSKWQEIRSKRDDLLKECDWTQLADAPLNSVEKQAWRAYRQELRDVPQSIPYINVLEQEPVWPVKPE